MQKQRHTVEERWSPTLAARGFTPVPTTFLDHYVDLGITPAEAMLIVHLMSFKWDERMPFPSIGRLREKTGLSDGQIRALLRRLEKQKGVLYRIRRLGRTNQFDFGPLIEKLEEIADREEKERADRQREERERDKPKSADGWDESYMPF